MKIVSKIKWMLLVASVSMSFLIFTGCAGHPNEEQIRVMEEARSAALAAEQKLADKRQECNELENQLAQKKQELEAAKQEREDIKQRLANWTGE